MIKSLIYIQFFIYIIVNDLFGQSVRRDFYETNGTVSTLYIDSLTETLYIGGVFDIVGQHRPALGLSDHFGNSKNLNTTNNELTLYNDIISDNNSGWFLCGNFSEINNTVRNFFAHIDSSGNLLPTIITCNAGLDNIALSGDTLFVSGGFTIINGVARNYLAAIKISTGAVLSWNPNPNVGVKDIKVAGNYVLVCGDFIDIGGQSRTAIAKLNRTTGASTSWNANANSGITNIFYNNNNVYAIGSFTTLGGSPRAEFARVSFTSALADSWNPTFNYFVTSACFIGDSVLVGGLFSSVNSTTRNYFACLSKSSGSLYPYYPIFNSMISSMCLSGTKLAIGGNFTSINSQNYRYATIFDMTIGSPISNTLHTNWAIDDIVSNSYGKFMWSGNFSLFDGEYHKNLAAIRLHSGKVKSYFNPNVASQVSAICSSNGNLFIGGAFNMVNSSIRTRMASIDTITGALNSWVANLDAGGTGVNDLIKYDSLIIIGGVFSSINGFSRSGLAAISGTSGILHSWNPTITDVTELEINAGYLYVMGGFTSINFTSIKKVGRFILPSFTLDTFNPNSATSIAAPGGILTNKFKNDTLYVAGSFNTFGGIPRYGIAAINLTTQTVTSFNPMTFPLGSMESVNGIETDNNFLYAVGYNGYMGTYPLNTAIPSFYPTLGYYSSPFAMNAILRYGKHMLMSGDLNTVMHDISIFKCGLVNFCFPIESPSSFIVSTDSICLSTGPTVYNYAIPEVTNGLEYGWYYSGLGVTILDNDTSAQLTFNPGATSGTLSVFTKGECCNSDSIHLNIFVDPCLFIDQSDDVNNLILFPNPNLGSFNLRHNYSGVCRIKINTIVGNNVYSESVNFIKNKSAQFNLNLPIGYYLFSLTTETGSTYSKPFVVIK